jgi:hypothetical protein
MNQGTQGYSLTKQTEGRKSRATVPLMVRVCEFGKKVPNLAREKKQMLFRIRAFVLRFFWRKNTFFQNYRYTGLVSGRSPVRGTQYSGAKLDSSGVRSSGIQLTIN